MADTIDFDEFYGSLSPEDIQTFSCGTEIQSNYQVLNDILDKLSDQNLNLENPELSIIKELKEELYFLTPADYEKKYDKKKINLIKDILNYKKTYDRESKETNKIIKDIKNSMKELTKSSNEIYEYGQKIFDDHDNDAKNLIKPIIKKEEKLDKIDKSLLSTNEQSTFESERGNVQNKLKTFDEKAFNALGKLHNILNKIFEKIKIYTEAMKSMTDPVNNIIDTIISKFNDFEEQSQTVVELIESSTDSPFIVGIFNEMKKANPYIINAISEAQNDLENKNNDLVKKIKECAKENQNLTNINNELSKTFQELTTEANQILSEIKSIKSNYTKSETMSENVVINGVDYSKFNDIIENGTKSLLRANEKIIADVSKLKKYFGEEQEKLKNTATLDLMFIMDITGSMTAYLDQAKQKIVKIMETLLQKCASVYVRIGFVGYRDYLDSNDDYVDVELNEDVESVRQKILKVNASGGGDCEDMPEGLNKTLNKNWKGKSRFAILIADVPCHGKQYHGLDDGFDKKPEGDSKYDVVDLVKGFAEKNITLLCLNITAKTVNLYNNFVDYYKKGRINGVTANIYILNFSEDPEKLVGVVVEAAEQVYEERHGVK